MSNGIITYTADSDEKDGVVHELTRGRSPSRTVIETIADLTGRDPTTMEPLYGWVDPDALDALFTGRSMEDGTLSVSFRYFDCTVLVADGFVHVTRDGDY